MEVKAILPAKRVKVIPEAQSLKSTPPRWIIVPQTFSDFKAKACSLWNITPDGASCFVNGCQMVSLDIIRDGDLIELREGTASDGVERDKWITLNVGGRMFTTTKLTLRSTEPASVLARMFEENDEGVPAWGLKKDSTGAVLIDRSGELFAPLLSYLRTGKLVVTERDNIQLLYTEAEFYNLERLQKELRPHLNQYDNKDDKIVQISASGPTSNLSRMDVVRALMVSPSTQELRFQGMNFEGCDLSRLDLRNINFKMSNLRGANLSYANISGANFDRADLTDAVCDHAVLFGVKLPCAVMERCSLQNVNADDPAGSRANFENVNLRNARLDNSQLNGANFRVANLKFASMKNCELKQASFPGANLEQCDLSGSNLYEANLRGANLVDTNFGHLANALHMSQTI
ncbi:BTB/POZ domain-containing protein KCTD9-like isoform X1 [Paramacrobiotus metropolitanus]|uniref:BTB/POZ domain-containing protein KCTD9-like isoform X1 n=1 Tax=Paramacrobiotus metropolitanus TaxID=2943436 RepID=UPI002445BEFD|nr:BTB/POZ domain-containing protein KCTD9-like isoform X1 [Paramacrobiotus metropolitanus]